MKKSNILFFLLFFAIIFFGLRVHAQSSGTGNNYNGFVVMPGAQNSKMPPTNTSLQDAGSPAQNTPPGTNTNVSNTGNTIVTPSSKIEKTTNVTSPVNNVKNNNTNDNGSVQPSGDNINPDTYSPADSSNPPTWIIFSIIVFEIALIVFWILMIIDAARRKISYKVIWLIIVIVFNWLGALVYYFVVRRPVVKKEKMINQKSA